MSPLKRKMCYCFPSSICALFCSFFAHGTSTIVCRTTNSAIAYFVGVIRQNGKEICGMAAFNLQYIYKVLLSPKQKYPWTKSTPRTNPQNLIKVPPGKLPNQHTNCVHMLSKCVPTSVSVHLLLSLTIRNRNGQQIYHC